jgi:hypothetical protein
MYESIGNGEENEQQDSDIIIPPAESKDDIAML